MGHIIIGAALEPFPGRTINWNDEPDLRLRRGGDCRRRAQGTVIQGIVLHTTKGIPGGADKRPQVVRPGFGPNVSAGLRCARYWSGSMKAAGAHFVVDFDGLVSQCADPMLDAAFHVGALNERTIGIEIYQGSDAELYARQLDATVQLVDWLTRRFGIQRQIPHRYNGRPLERLVSTEGRGFWGVYGHRDCSATRGAGDPGSAVFRLLGAAGYEDWDLVEGEDLPVWRRRQVALRISPVDGQPGPKTVAALLAAGKPHGLWVQRPGDLPDPPLSLVS